MYDDALADVYDAFYHARGKDYAAEAADVLALARARRPDVDSLLDIACGTGSHLRHFALLCPRVEGLELAPDMLDVARRRLPGVPLHEGDMRAFRLPRRFALVTCMFSSIGHLRTDADLTATLERFAAHLRPGGVIVVEPWWFPDTFLSGYVAAEVVKTDGRSISRTSHSVRDNDISRIEVHYVVADADGVRHFVDRHEITLFTRAQYEAAFTSAGCRVEYLGGGPSGRGLFVGVGPS